MITQDRTETNNIRVIDADGSEYYVSNGEKIAVLTSWGEEIHLSIRSCGDDMHHFNVCNYDGSYPNCYHVRQWSEHLHKNGARLLGCPKRD